MAKETESTVSVTVEQMKELLREARRPYVDEEVEQRRLTARERMRASDRRRREKEQLRWESCAHIRPEDNTSCVAWMRNSDGIVRGVCQRCQRPFRPEDEDYQQWLRVPTGTITSHG